MWIFWPRNEEIVPPKLVEEEVKKPVFKFVVMADVHNDNEELTKALRQASGDLMVLAGDLSINGSKTELVGVKKTLDDSAREFFVVPGNHDVIKKQFGAVFGKGYQVYKIDNLKLILIDNSYWAGLGEEQKLWIENEVGECKVLVCVGIMHMPLEHNFTEHVMGEDNLTGTADAKWLHKILVDNNVNSIYAGHLHYSSGYTIDNLRTNLVGAISRTRNNQTPRMMEVEFDGKTLTNKVVEIE